MDAGRVFDIVQRGTRADLDAALTGRNVATIFHPVSRMSLLAFACLHGRLDMGQALVERHGHPVDLVDPMGYTPLIWAFREDCMPAYRVLASLGVRQPQLGPRTRSPLLTLAAKTGDSKLALALVHNFKLDVNEPDTEAGNTYLFETCFHGHTGTALVLMNNCGAVPGHNKTGVTPLSVAAGRGMTSTALMFIHRGADVDAADTGGATPLTWACYHGRPVTVSALLAEGAHDVEDCGGTKASQVICMEPGSNPQDKPLVLAAFARNQSLRRLGDRVLCLAGQWDHGALQRAIAALMKEADAPWALSGAVAAASKEYWTAPRHPLDMCRDETGRTALAVAAAAGIFRNAELLVQAAASPLELDFEGKTPCQLALARGSHCMAVWFESMPIVYWAGHSKLRYRPAATAFLLCCRFSRMRAPAFAQCKEEHPIPGISYMHPDDWCIPQRDAYRILHFVGPELWGSVWPGPPRGYRGSLPGLTPRPVRRIPVTALQRAVSAAAVTGCAACGVMGSLKRCTRCRAASYCSTKCQKLHYPAHKAGCRLAAVALPNSREAACS